MKDMIINQETEEVVHVIDKKGNFYWMLLSIAKTLEKRGILKIIFESVV